MTLETNENERAHVNLPVAFYLIKWVMFVIVAYISITYCQGNVYAQYVTAVLFLSTIMFDASASCYYAHHSEKRKVIKYSAYTLTTIVGVGIVLFVVLAADEAYPKFINMKLSIPFEVLILAACAAASIFSELLILIPEHEERREEVSAPPPTSPTPLDGNSVTNSQGASGTTAQQVSHDSATPPIENGTTADHVANKKSESAQNTSGTPPSSS